MGLNKRLIGAGAVGSGALTPSENFKAVLYTGNSGTQAITGVGFKPDLVWIKERDDGAENHNWIDSTRGTNKIITSNSTGAEFTSTRFTSFDTDGFTLANNNETNDNNVKYVAWCWKAGGGTTSSNSDGSITSTVQANTDAGFSIVTWTSTSDAADTIGHGLNSKPDVVLYKKYSASGSWFWYTDVIDGSWDELVLNDSSAKSDFSGTYATSTTFKSVTSSSGANWITYCFHSVDNFSKIGSYVGNGSANGTIVETGFEPAFVLGRKVSGDNWWILDNKRNTTNPRNTGLFPNLTSAELTGGYSVDFLSNGFQLKTTDGALNASGSTYIYMAFAADPDTDAPTLASSFNVKTYTGNGGTQSITGVGFKPNMTWIKHRNEANDHVLTDSIRGTGLIYPNGNDAQNQDSQLTSFDSDGFSLAYNTGQNVKFNKSGGAYVAWNWKADDNEPTIFGGPAKAVYKFEDNANDVTGTYNGTANSITYATGKFNKAAVFNGSTGDIDLPSDIESSTMAVSLWAYLDDNAPTNQIIIEFDNGYGLNFPSFASGKLAAQWANSNANHTLSNSALSNNQWYHIAVNFRSGATDLYINGVKQTTGGTASDYLTADQNTIGSRRSGEFFDGMIDQVRIYNGNFQQIQVDELYAESTSQNDDLELGGPPEILVSANANAGFSIVKFTNNNPGSNARIPHGLSATPNMIIVKRTDGTEDWYVYHSGMGTSKFMRLNLSDAQGTATNLFNTVNSTVFNPSFTNTTGQTCIAYCFHDVAGYQKFGSYTGTGSSTRSFTGLGFQPDFVMVKSATQTSDWLVYDSTRGVKKRLVPNSSAAEVNEASSGSAGLNSFDSDGWTIGNDTDLNGNGNTYIYWAIKMN